MRFIKVIGTSSIVVLISLLLITQFIAQADDSSTSATGHNPISTSGSSSAGGLTDAEYNTSKTYFHEGKSEGMMESGCADLSSEWDGEDICSGEDFDWEVPFVGMDASMVRCIAKAYNTVMPMISSMSGGSNSEQGQDYCIFIGVAGQVMADFEQQETQNTLNSVPMNEETVHKESLMKAARSHEAHASASEKQGMFMGIETGCYVGCMATGQLPPTAGNIAKAAAAGLLTAFYYAEAEEYRKAAKKVEDLANKLPGLGDCNPVTERHCYCMQKSTRDDARYCLPEMHKRAIAQGSRRVSCIDNKMKADPMCRCVQTDSCYDQTFQTMIGGLGFADSFNSQYAGPLRKVFRGELKTGYLSQVAKRQNALNQKLSSLIESKGPELPPLTKEQKEEVKSMKDKYGIPPVLGQYLAATPKNKAVKNRIARYSRGRMNRRSRRNRRSYSRRKKGSKSKVLNFSGGKGLNPTKSKGRAGSNNDISKLLKKLKKKRKGQKGAGSKNVLSFVDRAEKNAAQINKDKSRGIFEIIHRRYQISGRRRLQIED